MLPFHWVVIIICFYSQGPFTDCSVHVRNGEETKTFGAHKIFLCGMSTFFAAHFDSQETNDITIKMDAKNFEAILGFMYAGHAIVGLEEVS